MDHSPEQPPATPLAPSMSGSPHESSAAVTPAASLQAPGSGNNPLVSAKGSFSQALLAAALARTAEGSHPSTYSPAKAPALPTSAPGAFEPNWPRSMTLVSGVTQEAATTAGNLAQARKPSSSSGEQPAALSGQEEATSSASFDSWRSKSCQDSTTTASTSKPADTTAVGGSRHSGSKTPIVAAAIDAQGSSPLVSVSLVKGLFCDFWLRAAKTMPLPSPVFLTPRFDCLCLLHCTFADMSGKIETFAFPADINWLFSKCKSLMMPF